MRLELLFCVWFYNCTHTSINRYNCIGEFQNCDLDCKNKHTQKNVELIVSINEHFRLCTSYLANLTSILLSHSVEEIIITITIILFLSYEEWKSHGWCWINDSSHVYMTSVPPSYLKGQCILWCYYQHFIIVFVRFILSAYLASST